jgi:hypothetical protein
LNRSASPIKYTYLKSEKFRDERELPISLSAVGFGQFVLNDGRRLAFPARLQVGFDFKTAFTNGTINQLLVTKDCGQNCLPVELSKLRIVPVEG